METQLDLFEDDKPVANVIDLYPRGYAEEQREFIDQYLAWAKPRSADNPGGNPYGVTLSAEDKRIERRETGRHFGARMIMTVVKRSSELKQAEKA